MHYCFGLVDYCFAMNGETSDHSRPLRARLGLGKRLRAWSPKIKN